MDVTAKLRLYRSCTFNLVHIKIVSARKRPYISLRLSELFIKMSMMMMIIIISSSSSSIVIVVVSSSSPEDLHATHGAGVLSLYKHTKKTRL